MKQIATSIEKVIPHLDFEALSPLTVSVGEIPNWSRPILSRVVLLF